MNLSVPVLGRFCYSFLAVFLIVFGACEEEEIDSIQTAPYVFRDGYFVARAGEDRSILTGETVNLQANFARNQRNSSFKWRFISRPDGSNAALNNSGDPMVSFQADQQGNYKVELGMFFDQYSTYDTVSVSAFTISDLEGSLTYPELGANGLIRQFMVFEDKLYAAGDFLEIGAVEAHGLARYDGEKWAPAEKNLQYQSVYQMIEYQNKLYIGGSSRELGGSDVVNFAYLEDESWIGLGFSNGAFDMVVFREVLYLNFGNKLGAWNGHRLDFMDIPGVERITHLEVADDMIYLRGYRDELCINSTDNVWVYDCEAVGSLLQFDGSSWSEVSISNPLGCVNSGTINWNYHIWITSDPGFAWRSMEGHQDKLYFPCGYSENGLFRDFTYPFEEIFTLQLVDNNDLFVSGGNQKVGHTDTSLMKWDGEQWYTLGDGIDGRVMTVQPYKGKLYIGGSFKRSVGQQPTNFVIWQGF